MTYTLTMEPERPTSEAGGSHRKDRTGGEDFPMNALQHLSSHDLCMLLECDPHDVLGRILELNHSPRYHNTLNAVELANVVEELRKAVAHGPAGSASTDNNHPHHG